MRACTFFGHHDCPSSIKPMLLGVLMDLIRNQSVNMFYVGNNGAFDRMALNCLCELARVCPQIDYAVVRERVCTGRDDDCVEAAHSLLPEGIEEVHPRFAISARNKWMLNRSEIVVAYVVHSWGGASKYAGMAERKGKMVINLGDNAVR